PPPEPRPRGLGEEPLETATESQRYDVPTERAEQALELLGSMIADDSIQALAVQVDDDHVAGQVGHRLLGPCFPGASLVELRVPHERDVPRPRSCRRLARFRLPRPSEVIEDVSVHEGRERGRYCAEAHRSRREVEPVRVLRATRVRLEAPER